jgi:hypothetical protein
MREDADAVPAITPGSTTKTEVPNGNPKIHHEATKGTKIHEER